MSVTEGGSAYRKAGKTVVSIEKAVYGGDGLARLPDGQILLLPFALPGEVVALEDDTKPAEAAASIMPLPLLRSSPERVSPRCIHFGVCGGCQYQMASYPEQLRLKGEVLRETLGRAGATELPAPTIEPSTEPWGYRNRIRLRVRTLNGLPRLGYSRRGTNDFLPVGMCPIAAPVLWATAEALMRVVAAHKGAADWVAAAAECEIACDEAGRSVQLHLLCPGPAPRQQQGFADLIRRLQAEGVPVASAGASRLHTPSGRAVGSLASFGKDGLNYAVAGESFWLQRGSFFQVNRYLVPAMVGLVTGGRSGRLAWDLYAGVGLFSRALARNFAGVTAVEANATAVKELRRGLRRPADAVAQQTTLDFLRGAVLQRERPDLVVLDPPRAGAGEEVCELLTRLAPREIVYVSCDPTTLARDLPTLVEGGYSVASLCMLDLFPQSYHLETVMVLRRGPVQS